jgi:2-isopropylmalate synthase
MGDHVRIFDTTLRDGEQAPGINLNARAKLEIAEQLARLGVDIIEAGFPAASPGDFAGVRGVAEQVKGPVIAALCRAVPADIDQAAGALAPAQHARLHVFQSTSRVHMEHMLHKTPQQVLESVRGSVAHARGYRCDIEFSAQDATRSDPDFLREIYTAAIEAGATTCNVPDTVGYMVPGEYAALVSWLMAEVPRAAEVTWSTHCHDDLGLSVASSVAAVAAGARQVEVAVNGIGERAGNCSLEEVVMILRTRGATLGFESEVNIGEIARTSRMVSLLTGYPVQPNKSVVGANAFAHESGIHQHGVLSERTTYEIMNPAELGYDGSRIVLGKHSGRHAVASALSDLGYSLDSGALDRAFGRFKELADRKPTITDADLEALVADEVLADEETWTFVGLQAAGGSALSPTATVALSAGGEVVQESAMGDGMVDAACAAIARATGVDAALIEFHVSAVTGGTDALGGATVGVQLGERRVTGRAVGTDIVEASARAYRQAVNNLIRAGAAGAREPAVAAAAAGEVRVP